MRSPLALGLGIVGLVVALFSAALTMGERDFGVVSYGAASPGGAVVEVLAGVALFGASTLVA